MRVNGTASRVEVVIVGANPACRSRPTWSRRAGRCCWPPARCASGVTAFTGLYVAGHPWLSTRGSGLLYGVAADAARIAQHIAMDSPGRTRPSILHPVPTAERQPS